ncbi:MAG: efflux transporter periplasmic adaptor subunit, partial [Phycisphaerales bacterium]
ATFGDHVFVVAADEKDPSKLRAKQRLVKTGAMIGTDLIILEGLKPGEEVAADGSFKLFDGALVTRPHAAAAPVAKVGPADR